MTCAIYSKETLALFIHACSGLEVRASFAARARAPRASSRGARHSYRPFATAPSRQARSSACRRSNLQIRPYTTASASTADRSHDGRDATRADPFNKTIKSRSKTAADVEIDMIADEYWEEDEPDTPTSVETHPSPPQARLKHRNAKHTPATSKDSTRPPSQRNRKTPAHSSESNTDASAPDSRPAWAVHKSALAAKFPSGWNPQRKLSPDAVLAVRQLHAQDPGTFTTPVLAAHFKISPEAIRRILKSKWAPSEEEHAEQRRRWLARGKAIWEAYAAKGLHPPKKWRDMGVKDLSGRSDKPENKGKTAKDWVRVKGDDVFAKRAKARGYQGRYLLVRKGLAVRDESGTATSAGERVSIAQRL